MIDQYFFDGTLFGSWGLDNSIFFEDRFKVEVQIDRNEILSHTTIEIFTKRKLLQYSIILGVFLFITNLNAMVDSFFHPEIAYFDHEHLIVGSISGLVTLLLIGLVLHYINHLEVITENAQSSNHHKQTLIELTPVGLVLCKMTGEIVEMNAAFADTLGQSVEETKKDNFWDITLDASLNELNHIQGQLLTIGQYDSFSKTIVRPDGQPVVFRSQGVLVGQGGEDLIWSSIENIAEFQNTEKILKGKVEALEEARANIKRLKGLLPMCGKCKRIRNDEGEWVTVESYIENHSEASTTGGMCRECQDELYGSKPWYQKSLTLKPLELGS